MPVSQKVIEANRRNAQKSTGPRTALGKLRSSRNALKHGFYSNFDFLRAFALIPGKYRRRFIEIAIRKFRPANLDDLPG